MTIAEFDHLSLEEKKKLLYQCCGSTAWVNKMLSTPPAEDLIDLLEDAEECWYSLAQEDWKEAFSQIPKVADLTSLKEEFSGEQATTSEQPATSTASEQTLQALADGHKAYAEKFGYAFVTGAADKSPIEMLGMLTARLQNKPGTEITIAMGELNKITQQRLEKLFGV
ncbi:MAG TPA: 2-oxo-4-hydroxy-4-carboxy-5-ureidoimidazoline decarboxylase [Chitinophagaceae bacterium]|nr:2-oxo-4-hydroxy-4-carboxy-5-ureidoimidazoline decarboxylase [Chitinophagaceae bacterium]